MKKFPLFVSILLSVGVVTASAQRFTTKGEGNHIPSKPDTGSINAEKSYLALRSGDVDRAKEYLTSADPSNPFSMYVHATLTEDAGEAAGVYKEIVEEYHDKPVAREALLQLYRFHYAAGDYRSARTDYLQLQKYPEMSQLVDPAGLGDTLQDSSTFRTRIEGTDSLRSLQAERGSAFVVQLGVFSTQENAKKFVSQMKANGIIAKISTKTVAGRLLYTVSTGKFATHEEAIAFAASLKSRSINCVVIEFGETKE